MKRFFCATGLVLCSLLPVAAAAATIDAPACMGEVQKMMGQRQRFYRSVVVGQPNAKDSPQGSVLFDKEGVAWIKTDDDQWKSEEDERTDDAMDENAESPARLGWLEVKKAATSELIPPILQSMRAFQCKMEDTCELLSRSLNATEDDELTIKIPGCEEEKLDPLAACQPETAQETASFTDTEALITQCASLRDNILNRERGLLKLLIAYDAAERSLYQFMGMTGDFFDDLKSTLLGPVWQAVRAFQSLGRIPCFTAQCEQ